jgi:ribosomal small subunit protein bTHX
LVESKPFTILANNLFKSKMGRGDKKTKKGKISIGSFGNSRRRKSAKKKVVVVEKTEVVVSSVDVKPKVKRAPKKKEAAE